MHLRSLRSCQNELRLRILANLKIGWRHSLVPSLLSWNETLTIAVKNYEKQVPNFSKLKKPLFAIYIHWIYSRSNSSINSKPCLNIYQSFQLDFLFINISNPNHNTDALVFCENLKSLLGKIFKENKNIFLFDDFKYYLLQGTECNMANVLRVSQIFQTYFTSSYESEIIATHEKQIKYLSILHEANVR